MEKADWKAFLKLSTKKRADFVLARLAMLDERFIDATSGKYKVSPMEVYREIFGEKVIWNSQTQMLNDLLRNHRILTYNGKRGSGAEWHIELPPRKEKRSRRRQR